jgi:hypothetical protein
MKIAEFDNNYKSLGNFDATPSANYQNEQYLLKMIKERYGITDEDMQSRTAVKIKVRDSKLKELLS